MELKDLAKVATKYIGKTETPNNSGFSDKEFQKRMEQVGWSIGQSWCAYFTELCAIEAFPSLKDELTKLFSASATATWKNFQIDKKTSITPKVGSLAVWRYGNGWQGHIGVVSKIVDDKTFESIEGNTNDKGGREGYIVTPRTRKIGSKYSSAGLNLIGFINII
jgi:hypothetical protein